MLSARTNNSHQCVVCAHSSSSSDLLTMILMKQCHSVSAAIVSGRDKMARMALLSARSCSVLVGCHCLSPCCSSQRLMAFTQVRAATSTPLFANGLTHLPRG